MKDSLAEFQQLCFVKLNIHEIRLKHTEICSWSLHVGFLISWRNQWCHCHLMKILIVFLPFFHITLFTFQQAWSVKEKKNAHADIVHRTVDCSATCSIFQDNSLARLNSSLLVCSVLSHHDRRIRSDQKNSIPQPYRDLGNASD